MRTIIALAVVALTQLSGCTRRQPLDGMFAPAACDSVPPPLALGEHAGGELPRGTSDIPDSGVVVGVVVQARTQRPLSGATVGLRPESSSVASPPVAMVVSNTAGGFSLRPVRPGTYVLRTALMGHLPRERSVIVRAGAADTVKTEMTYWHCVGY